MSEASGWDVVFVARGTAEVHRRLQELEEAGGRVLRLDSRDLMTEQGIYDTFAEALLFPAYFGRNWDAMVDCLDDLCGAVTGGVGVAAVIGEADRLLEADHFSLFEFDELNEFDRERIARRVAHPDLTITVGEGFVAAALNP
ncbi:barstar family protein [Streptomyces sp. NPDC002779]|uniref:barstar family protein n=1 Tax=Streptomyces sp. NPDC002779 TaxID=3364664 RepID=UPI0036879DD6